MKSILTTAIMLVFLVSGLQAQTYTMDNSKSEIYWEAEKVTGRHNGKVTIKSANLTFSEGLLTGGKVVVDMNSISCDDIEDAGSNDKLVGHLKSSDFFDVGNHPTATFTFKEVIPQGKERYKVIGDITIKGVSKEQRFVVNVENEDDGVTAVADLTLDRSQYGIKYGSGSFFKGLGDNLIYDNFVIGVTLVAKK